MMLRTVLLVASAACISCFQSPVGVQLRLRSSRPLCSSNPQRPGALACTAALDRRALLTFAGAALLSQFDVRNPAPVHAADLKQAVMDGLLRFSNQEPYEGKCIALFSDGSKEFKAAEEAIVELGGTVLKIDPKAKVPEIRNKYKEADCFAAMVPDGEVLKRIMQGRGIECERCGYYGDAAPPKWFVVLGNTKKTGAQIQEESNLLGRECDPQTGVCFQVGKGIDVFTLPELATAPPQQPAR